ncbi:MAG: hypothetical protein J6T28_09185 [Paludibacteraceae bacterium]|nr:hypothetical protein [Paludibacteraceae bacterium]
MAFKVKMISDEDSKSIAENLELAITDTIQEAKSSLDENMGDAPAKAPAKKKKKVSKPGIDFDKLVAESDIDPQKWRTFKEITLLRPMEFFDMKDDIKTVPLPTSLVDALNRLSLFNKSAFNKTIIANLIVRFLKENRDIIELIEQTNKSKR